MRSSVVETRKERTVCFADQAALPIMANMLTENDDDCSSSGFYISFKLQYESADWSFSQVFRTYMNQSAPIKT